MPLSKNKIQKSKHCSDFFWALYTVFERNKCDWIPWKTKCSNYLWLNILSISQNHSISSLIFFLGDNTYKLNVFVIFIALYWNKPLLKTHVKLTFRQLKQILQYTNIQHITLNTNHYLHFYTYQNNNHYKQNLLFERINDVIM